MTRQKIQHLPKLTNARGLADKLRIIAAMKKSYFVQKIFLLALLQSAQASAIDLQPGECRAPKPGTNVLLLTYLQSERGDRYSSGSVQPGNSRISSTQSLVRLGRSFELAEKPAFFYVQGGVGDVKPGGSLAAAQGDSGMVDTAFALAVWPYANRETQTYFGVAAYLIAPTGSYSRDRSFNMGENRYRTALQTGFQLALTKQLNWMGAFDATWFEKNSDFRPTRDTLEQKALYAGQTSLQYELSPAYSMAASYFYTVGGETSVNGLNRNDVTRLQRYLLTGAANLPIGRITLQYGGDLKTENGYFEDKRWILRYTKLF